MKGSVLLQSFCFIEFINYYYFYDVLWPTHIDLRTYSTSCMSIHNIFKNGSSVEFCYGKNIDIVYVRSYDQKKIYSKEMKQFYAYYKKSKTT